MVEASSSLSELSNQLLMELTGNILPFWMAHAPDKDQGGFHGAIHNNLEIDHEVPRSSVLCARILWSFSAAYRVLGKEVYLAAAQQAFDYLAEAFWDQTHGGVYWSIDKDGHPVSDRKHSYAQAFAIYGLSEYMMATQGSGHLQHAQDIFRLIDQYAYDRVDGGYFESRTRDWQDQEDARLSPKDLSCRKSMNTMLHLLEAFTNLRRVWPDENLSKRLRDILLTFLNHIFDPDSGHLRMYFDDRWKPLSSQISFGHDIEASWLLCEAAGTLNDPEFIKRTQRIAIQLSESVRKENLSFAAGYISERAASSVSAQEPIWWWSQVEGMVGYYNSYQITGDEAYLEIVLALWEFIQDRFIDRDLGGWFKTLSPEGNPLPDGYKIGPWEGPYHHTRACLEIIRRISDLQTLE